MHRLMISFAIILVGLSGGAALCQIELPASGSAASGISLQAVAGFILSPWMTFALVFLGMMLIISEVVSLPGRSSWGLTGTAGVLCLGCVVGSSVLAGVAAGIGIGLLFAGLALLLIESRVLPGRGICAVAGVVCLFLGMFWTLEGASAGVSYAVAVSALFALMSAVAFLAHLPTNSAWHAVGRRLQIRECRSPRAATKSGRVQITRTGPPPGHETTRKDADSDDDQQIIRPGS